MILGCAHQGGVGCIPCGMNVSPKRISSGKLCMRRVVGGSGGITHTNVILKVCISTTKLRPRKGLNQHPSERCWRQHSRTRCGWQGKAIVLGSKDNPSILHGVKCSTCLYDTPYFEVKNGSKTLELMHGILRAPSKLSFGVQSSRIGTGSTI